MCELLWVFEFLSYLCDFRRQKWLWVVSWGLPSFEFHSMSEGLCVFCLLTWVTGYLVGALVGFPDF